MASREIYNEVLLIVDAMKERQYDNSNAKSKQVRYPSK